MRFFSIGVAAAVGLLVTPFAGVRAQDVSVAPLVFSDPILATNASLPVPKRRLDLSWPSELSKTDQPGIVFVSLSLNEDGQRVKSSTYASTSYFQEVVTEALVNSQWTPAKLGDRPVKSVVWLTVIFNPKSAKENGATSSPRVLTAAPAVRNEKAKENTHSPTVWITLHIDEKGAITLVGFDEPAYEALRSDIEAALPSWRIAPAKKEGVAIAADLHVPMQIPPRPDELPNGKIVLPKVIHQIKPEYPVQLKLSGMRGDVEVSFVVDETGKVTNPVVQRSTNPAFDRPAIEALLKWKFAPATLAGKPVKMRMLQPITFSLQFTPNGGMDAFEINTDKKVQEKLPEEFRYDVPPKAKGVLYPVYPFALMKEKARGSAKITMLINPEGHVAAVQLISADRPEFGLSLTSAVEAFQFIPAMKKGVPTNSLLTLNYDFSPDNGITGTELMAEDDWSLFRKEQKHPEAIVPAGKNLDHPLKPISTKSPVFPCSKLNGAESGDALIEFLVDEKGRARLPRIVKAKAPDFGYSAIQAITEWRFEPPTANNKSVIVRIRAPLTFGLQSGSAAPSDPTKKETDSAPKTGSSQ